METGEKGIELFASAPKPLPKISTHIEGLDQILEGGLPAQRTIFIMGEPGTGKTVLALEIPYRGARRGEPGILVSFEESPQDIRENAATFGWDLEALEDRGLLYLMEGKMDSATLIEGRFSLEPLLAIISGKAREMGAKRAVLDASDVLLAMIDDASMARAQLQFLTEWLSASGLTTIMTIKPRQVGIGRLFQEFFDSMSDCVISLSARVMDQVTTRRLRVLKYRGSGFGKNEYPFVISGSGIKLIPITVFQLLHKPFGERISSGIERLDGLLGGGFFRNSCILLAGEPGTGKTLMASAFAEHRCERERRFSM
jgi:circadian clock protein KaiC